jgi:tetratricopeptide (TPR) repeat protein
MNKNIGYDTSPTSKENALELIKPADQQEETAFRDFLAISPEKLAKRIEKGEGFLKKYPQSGYREGVYASLTAAYLQTNQVQKMEEAGKSAIALNPKDAPVLAMLGQTLPRVMDSSTPEPAKRLEMAEQYAKRAIEAVPTLKKPADTSDQQFDMSKNQTLAIAHSGLGLVCFRRGDFAGAIAELDQSVKLDPRGDATNYYVLGVANQNAKHYAEAAAAFGKCAESPGSLQATCKDNAEKAKQLSSTAASTPK